MAPVSAVICFNVTEEVWKNLFFGVIKNKMTAIFQ